MTSQASEPLGVLDELSLGECLSFLAGTHIGRIAVVHDGYPVVFPVNYRMVGRASGGPVIVVRSRPGGTIAVSDPHVAFQIDGIDECAGAGWSVLVRGIMHHVDPDAIDELAWSDPHPWAPGRDEWLVIDPVAVSGRRLVSGDAGWGFHPLGYL